MLSDRREVLPEEIGQPRSNRKFFRTVEGEPVPDPRIIEVQKVIWHLSLLKALTELDFKFVFCYQLNLVQELSIFSLR